MMNFSEYAIAKVGQSHVGATASVAREVGNNGTAGDRGGRPYRQIQKNSDSGLPALFHGILNFAID